MAAPVTRGAWRAAALVVAVALGACGSHNGPTGVTGVGADQTTVGTHPAAVAGAPGATTSGRAGSATTRRVPQAGGDNGDASVVVASDAIVTAAHKAPGQFAGVLLAAGPARSLVLDVRVEPGVAANSDTLARVAQMLRDQSGKAVAVHGPVPLADTASVHDADAVRRIADNQGEADGSDVAVVHLFYFAGHFAQDGVLGVTVRADTIAVFPDEIASASSPLVGEARLERAVVTHEGGHVLGLVDLYLDDGRDDSEHPGHSTNRNSVMYWAVETDVVAQVLGGPPPVEFDGADLADLAKIHAGVPAQVT